MLKGNEFKFQLHTNFIPIKGKSRKKLDKYVSRKKLYLLCCLIQEANERHNFQNQGVKENTGNYRKSRKHGPQKSRKMLTKGQDKSNAGKLSHNQLKLEQKDCKPRLCVIRRERRTGKKEREKERKNGREKKRERDKC